MENKPIIIYLDDVRTPMNPDPQFEWIVVRDHQELVDKVTLIGLKNIHTISLDHDLGESAMTEYFSNTSPNSIINYDNIIEKTGYDSAKWLVEQFYKDNPEWTEYTKEPFQFPKIFTHSANPVGSANIMGYINNFLLNSGQAQSCVRVRIPHTIIA